MEELRAQAKAKCKEEQEKKRQDKSNTIVINVYLNKDEESHN